MRRPNKGGVNPASHLPHGGSHSSDILPSDIGPGLRSALEEAGVDPADPSVSKVLEISLMAFSGSLPLPPALLLKEWEECYPGITGKLIEWTEQQAEHRRALDKSEESRLNRGQAIAGAVALGGLALATVCGIFGNPVVASIIAVVAVGGPTAAVVIARSDNLFQYRADPKDLNGGGGKRKKRT